MKMTDRTLIRISSIIGGITANVALFVELLLLFSVFLYAHYDVKVLQLTIWAGKDRDIMKLLF